MSAADLHTLPTPYDGSSKPFTIGLKPLDPARWIEVDDDLVGMLAEKNRLMADMPGAVFAAEIGTEAAQTELLALLLEHLLSSRPDVYRREGDIVGVGEAARVALAAGEAPLATAARLVADDLVLMRRGFRRARPAPSSGSSGRRCAGCRCQAISSSPSAS